MKKRTVIILAFIFGIGAVIVVATNLLVPRMAPVTTTPEIPPGSTLVSFLSSETGEAIEVKFQGMVAVLNGLTFENLVLNETRSASGARYENAATGVALWNKGNDVILYQGEDVIFKGSNGEPSNDNSMNPKPVNAEAKPSKQLLGTWAWVRTELNDESVVTPKKPGAFTLTFTDDGQMGGTTDCNNFGGTYAVEGTMLTPGALAMTEMYCEGSQEGEFVQFFSAPEGVAGVPFLFSENDELIINLPFDSGSVLFKRVLEERV